MFIAALFINIEFINIYKQSLQMANNRGSVKWTMVHHTIDKIVQSDKKSDGHISFS